MMCTVHCRRAFFCAALAQPAEHPAHNRVVAGSIPARGMIYSRSSIGRALVSKTRSCRLSPCRECQIAVLRRLQYSRASGGESSGCSSTPPVYVVRETECMLGVLLILISCRSQGRLLFCRKAKRMAESIERKTVDEEDSQDGSRRIV